MDAQIQEAEDFLLLENEVNKIVELIDEVKEADDLRTRITLSISLIEESEGILEEYKKILLPEKEVELFLDDIDKYLDLVQEVDDLRSRITLLDNAEAELDEVVNDLKIMEKRNTSLLKELGLCPFCGSKIKEK